MSKRQFLADLYAKFPDWLNMRVGSSLHMWQDVELDVPKTKGREKVLCDRARVLLITGWPPSFTIETIYLSAATGEEAGRGRIRKAKDLEDAYTKVLEITLKL